MFKRIFSSFFILLALFCINIVALTAQGTSNHDELIVNGNKLILEKKYNEAFDAYDEATKLNPDSFIGWFNKGITLDLLGRYESAVKALNQAVKIEPNNHEAWFVKGNALDHNTNFEESISAFDKALSLKPDYIDASI